MISEIQMVSVAGLAVRVVAVLALVEVLVLVAEGLQEAESVWMASKP